MWEHVRGFTQIGKLECWNIVKIGYRFQIQRSKVRRYGMIILINSSKTLDFQPPAQISKCTQPELLTDAEYLVRELRALSELQLSELMGISRKLAQQIYDAFHGED